MKLFNLILALTYLALSQSCLAENNATVEDAQKEVVKITQSGFEPAQLKLTKEDASVFFLNATKDALMTIEIDFRNKRTHCATPNLKIGTDGYLRSVSPIGPKDFAVTCFPSKGEYKVTALGVRPDGKPVTGTIIVE